MTRRISIFGSTGSIGLSTIDLIRRDPEAYEVVALTGGHNIAVAIEEAARRPADWVMSAIVGAAGLPPGLAALETGATLALANKESLVTAGPLIMETARKHGAHLLPVDSEHSAVFQALVGEDLSAVERVIITASGGAFRDWPIEDLPSATLAQASSHPNWDMGQRITIDSASMFNKALELIETRPDMRHAIGYALHWPERRRLPVERLDLARIGSLEFRAPSDERYPALRLARAVMETRGMSGAIFNAAKETALDGFIAGRIGFTRMAGVVEEVLTQLSGDAGLINDAFTLDNVRAADQMARERAAEIISGA